eukprot:Tbor_TRINITY_DN5429_c3_g4::TRINITY_DN5429_c3_g4_i1::g.24684::m.24684
MMQPGECFASESIGHSVTKNDDDNTQSDMSGRGQSCTNIAEPNDSVMPSWMPHDYIRNQQLQAKNQVSGDHLSGKKKKSRHNPYDPGLGSYSSGSETSSNFHSSEPVSPFNSPKKTDPELSYQASVGGNEYNRFSNFDSISQQTSVSSRPVYVTLMPILPANILTEQHTLQHPMISVGSTPNSSHFAQSIGFAQYPNQSQTTAADVMCNPFMSSANNSNSNPNGMGYNLNPQSFTSGIIGGVCGFPHAINPGQRGESTDYLHESNSGAQLQQQYLHHLAQGHQMHQPMLQGFNQAAQNQGMHQNQHQTGGGRGRGNGGGSISSNPSTITFQELESQKGNLAEMARTATGSSFIQASIREGCPDAKANLRLVSDELFPHIGDLLLDAHGCYIIKGLMEKLPPDVLAKVVSSISADENLIFNMCTHSLHTRRAVQFLMDTVDSSFIIELLIRRCGEVASTQQGCIVTQRAMDISKDPQREQLFRAIMTHLLEFSLDPFANYVIQHLLEIGDTNANTNAILPIFKGRVRELSCNKFASNVVEKCLFHLSPNAQHEILMEMYDVSDEVLLNMLQDSFGNYIIQSSIALASSKDIGFISDRLRSVLMKTPYGHKIEARLDRRLKGKTMPPRNAMGGNNNNHLGGW